MNELLTKNQAEISNILAKYPADRHRSAVMPLLYLAQRQNGYVSRQSVEDIAEICEITPTEVVSVVGFYTLFYDEPAGRYRIQVCTDMPCALQGAEDFLKNLCQNVGIKIGETTADGLITIEEVKCLAGCHRAPVFQVQGDGDIVYHENQSVKSALKVIDDLRDKAAGEVKK
ncbi:MAG TPA: NADH-quinone oxidoreductase subunit NuoE [Longilinea sp.]|nr:NADH-quinone oxidoreductase subunit NuoE [Longilinea sp.]